MTIEELRRLHEHRCYAEIAALLALHVPDILAALEDRERLDWLAETGCFLIEVPVVEPRHWEVRDYDDNCVGRGDIPRKAIDAARGVKP